MFNFYVYCFIVFSFYLFSNKKQTLRPKSIYRGEMEHGRKKTNNMYYVFKEYPATERIDKSTLITFEL